MRALPSDLRRQLENAVVAARRAADSASQASLEPLGVFAERRPDHLDTDQAKLRNGLRAKMRQLGGEPELLIAECAYEQWHRLLFARFLAENRLLLHPEFQAPVTLSECEEWAAELGEPDGWSVAARFASEILPGIFRLDDPCLQLQLAPEGRHALEQILDDLSRDVFVTDDALGWVYQLWQKEKKDEVNASERKVGGSDLSAATQLFTENYMVRFLLQNSLGAWWASRHPDSPLLKDFEYLRDDLGTSGAEAFARWPERVAEVTVMDPCCGSGHFLVEAFDMLSRMRAEEEGLSLLKAQDAVLSDNLFGLEIDPRCVQIAMFGLALQAWRSSGSWRELPTPHLACAGMPVRAKAGEWMPFAQGDARIEKALGRLHMLFLEADTLGSLVDPKGASWIPARDRQLTIEEVSWEELVDPLDAALKRESSDPATAVLGERVGALARAADLLTREYTLVATNVPFLSRSKQAQPLVDVADSEYALGSADLATMMLERCLRLANDGGAIAVVTPQNWQIQESYRDLRRQLLRSTRWVSCARLGNNAWQGRFTGGVPFKLHTILSVLANETPDDASFVALDLGSRSSPAEKAALLAVAPARLIRQADQVGNPDSRIVFGDLNWELPQLSEFCHSFQGLKTGDDGRFRRHFWEVDLQDGGAWERLRSSHVGTRAYGGCEAVVLWEHGEGQLAASPGARVVGGGAWGRRGVLVGQMGDLPCSLYLGELFDSNASPLIPSDPDMLAALWAFCSSSEYSEAVRMVDTSVGVKNRSLTAVPFDAARWKEVARERGPLPESRSSDPTQWLCDGRLKESTAPLHVAVARMAGFQWPEQPDADDLAEFVDEDGIVCLLSVAGEDPAADRLQRLLAAAYGGRWSPSRAKELIEETGSKKKTLAEWLRDDFFKQHCTLFHHRPFVWHIWDGQKDGFSALVDYHRLDRQNLEKLTYTYLGQDWVERQRAAARDEVAGADARLAAAQDLQRNLEAILEGEKPYDIYVRWKSIEEQPIGWEPDLNDGVRLNIRPFVEAGVLRSKVKVHWRKDRGKNLDASERLNDIHLSLNEKREARHRAGRA